MSDLVAFLRARLDEDEAAAKAAADYDVVVCADQAGIHYTTARVLREVEAKRARLDRYERAISGDLPEWKAGQELIAAGAAILLGVLRDDAVVYRDHPDYDGAWKP